MRLLLVVLVALPLAACPSLNVPSPQNAEQIVYTARASYGASFYGPFARYASLPDCDENPQPCSDDEVMVVLNDIHESVKATLDAAETVVREDPNGDGSVDWARAAQEAVNAAIKILRQYGVGGSQ